MLKTRQLRAVHATKVFREVTSEAKTHRPRPDMVPGVVKKPRSVSSIRDAVIKKAIHGFAVADPKSGTRRTARG